MDKGIEYRRASIQDVNELYVLMKQYIVDFYQQSEPQEGELKGLIHSLLENPSNGLQFVAEENGKLIGFSTLYFTFSTLKVKKAAILNDLYVAPGARGKKVGENLFQTCLAFIRENDFAYMNWETAKDNIIAQSLYNKMGGKLSDWLVYEIN